MSNEQEDRMTDQMWEAMPNGAHVVYVPGMAYDTTRAPVVCVSVGLHQATTYRWTVCSVCGQTTWCVYNYNVRDGNGGDVCDQHRA